MTHVVTSQREHLALLAGRDRASLAAIAMRLSGSHQFVEHLDEPLIRRHRFSYRAAVLLADTVKTDYLARLARAGRSVVSDGAVVILTPQPIDAATLFSMLLAGVDVCELEPGSEPPAHLPALVDGLWPGVRRLLDFCRHHAFSRAQTRVFLAACAGLSKVEAHEIIGCSVRTLESHWSSIFSKVSIRCMDGVMAAALRHVVLHGTSAAG